MKPHNRHAPGLPSATNALINKSADRMRRHVARELAAAAAAENAKRETVSMRAALKATAAA
ncbi:MAG: hypothetical protein CK431_04415 [Mycobacterium sp.]|nr:MAG: hypothetical protein CK431_04415 [Mycobacterium sp.]